MCIGRGLGLLRPHRDRALSRATVRGVHRHGGRWRHGRSRLQAVSDPCRGEARATSLHDMGTDWFVIRRQLSLDLRSFPRVVVGTKYNGYLTGAEWNTWVSDGDWGAHFPAEQVAGLLAPADRPGRFSHPRREHSRRPGGARTAHQGRRPHLPVRPPDDRPALHPAVAPRGVGPRRGRPRRGAQGGGRCTPTACVATTSPRTRSSRSKGRAEWPAGRRQRRRRRARRSGCRSSSSWSSASASSPGRSRQRSWRSRSSARRYSPSWAARASSRGSSTPTLRTTS